MFPVRFIWVFFGRLNEFRNKKVNHHSQFVNNSQQAYDMNLVRLTNNMYWIMTQARQILLAYDSLRWWIFASYFLREKIDTKKNSVSIARIDTRWLNQYSVDRLSHWFTNKWPSQPIDIDLIIFPSHCTIWLFCLFVCFLFCRLFIHSMHSSSVSR